MLREHQYDDTPATMRAKPGEHDLQLRGELAPHLLGQMRGTARTWANPSNDCTRRAQPTTKNADSERTEAMAFEQGNHLQDTQSNWHNHNIAEKQMWHVKPKDTEDGYTNASIPWLNPGDE